MKKAAIFFLACVAVLAARAAAADDLPAREAAGQAAAATPAGQKYDAALMPWMQEAGDACYPKGAMLPASELGTLTVVADVTWAGRLINIEVAPPTKTAACVGAELSQYQFPAPPADRFALLLMFRVSN